MKKRAAEARPNLLADERDDLVVLQLSLRRVPASRSTRPRLLPLPHPVVGHDVCVISDDRPKSGSPSASDLLHASKLPVSEVIPLSTLRTDYRPYESRRRLAASHALFVADRAILPLLPRVLGKAFYSTNKAPIGVDFTRVDGRSRLDMEEEEIVDNVMAAVEAAVEKVPKMWANVRALHLKAVDSVALPIYQVVPELGMKIVGSGEVSTVASADDSQKVGKKGDKGKRRWENENKVKEASLDKKKIKKGKTEEGEEEEEHEGFL
ncbi:unnamed protein product [Miscanthus lutarioriparius]|uniref:Ribosomal protein L1 n=1 Tax=Miscanthus lutarioriparius TaxID=422564 RepID=A0A811RFX9_9POAL|nr:unnamed protein product [Miscanthus lutarioriparius]